MRAGFTAIMIAYGRHTSGDWVEIIQKTKCCYFLFSFLMTHSANFADLFNRLLEGDMIANGGSSCLVLLLSCCAAVGAWRYGGEATCVKVK